MNKARPMHHRTKTIGSVARIGAKQQSIPGVVTNEETEIQDQVTQLNIRRYD